MPTFNVLYFQFNNIANTKTKINTRQKEHEVTLSIWLFDCAMQQYIKDKKDEDFLFPSRNGKHQHIKPNTAYKIIKRAAEEVGLENIATHSMRKTFGLFMYEQTKDVALIMDLLNHSSQSISLRYIGKNQDSQDRAMTKFQGF